MTSIPVLHAAGNHYDIGFEVGHTFKDRIKAYFHEFSDLGNRFLPFYSTKQGQQIYNEYLELTSKVCFEYMEEVRGIADGSGISFIELFLMHIRSELQTYLDTEVVPECTTVYVNKPQSHFIAHNEDTSVAVQGRGYILDAKLTNGGDFKQGMWAYCYPGIVAGNTFGCNSGGLIITANALYPKHIYLNKLPRQFVNRMCLDAKDPEHLLHLIENPSCSIASGCSVNVGWRAKNSSKYVMFNLELCSIRMSPKTIIDKFDVQVPSTYIHYNMYDHMEVDQLDGRTTSSEHRKRTSDSLPPPSDIQTAVNILGNEDDNQYPIYRSSRPTDPGCTVATGIFDMFNRRIMVHVDNPKFSAPIIDVPFPFM